MSTSSDLMEEDIGGLIDKLCTKLQDVNIQGEQVSPKSGNTLPPSSPKDEAEKYSAAFPPLNPGEIVKENKDVNTCSWSRVLQCNSGMNRENIIESGSNKVERPIIQSYTLDEHSKENAQKLSTINASKELCKNLGKQESKTEYSEIFAAACRSKERPSKRNKPKRRKPLKLKRVTSEKNTEESYSPIQNKRVKISDCSEEFQNSIRSFLNHNDTSNMKNVHYVTNDCAGFSPFSYFDELFATQKVYAETVKAVSCAIETTLFFVKGTAEINNCSQNVEEIILNSLDRFRQPSFSGDFNSCQLPTAGSLQYHGAQLDPETNNVLITNRISTQGTNLQKFVEPTAQSDPSLENSQSLYFDSAAQDERTGSLSRSSSEIYFSSEAEELYSDREWNSTECAASCNMQYGTVEKEEKLAVPSEKSQNLSLIVNAVEPLHLLNRSESSSVEKKEHLQKFCDSKSCSEYANSDTPLVGAPKSEFDDFPESYKRSSLNSAQENSELSQVRNFSDFKICDVTDNTVEMFKDAACNTDVICSHCFEKLYDSCTHAPSNCWNYSRSNSFCKAPGWELKQKMLLDGKVTKNPWVPYETKTTCSFQACNDSSNLDALRVELKNEANDLFHDILKFERIENEASSTANFRYSNSDTDFCKYVLFNDSSENLAKEVNKHFFFSPEFSVDTAAKVTKSAAELTPISPHSSLAETNFSVGSAMKVTDMPFPSSGFSFSPERDIETTAKIAFSPNRVIELGGSDGGSKSNYTLPHPISYSGLAGYSYSSTWNNSAQLTDTDRVFSSNYDAQAAQSTDLNLGLQESHVYQTEQKNAAASNIDYKASKKPCYYYVMGCCQYRNCRFSHDLSTTTCRYWLQGNCFKDSTCPFLHGVPPSAKPSSDMHKELPKRKDPQKSKQHECAYKLDSETDFPSLATQDCSGQISSKERKTANSAKLQKATMHPVGKRKKKI